jgi:putative SOS response-associated peptidase YedK
MCGRTSLFVPPSVVEERFDAEFGSEFVPRYNIAPRQDLYAVTNQDRDAIDTFEWGFLPGFVDDPEDSPRPINARAETIDEKPYFRDAYANRRCLIIADGFYEWQGDRGSKEPYRIQRTDEQPFAFAGLWETWSPDGAEDDGTAQTASATNGDGTLRTCTIITTAANDVVEPIHDRMPVILAEDEEDAWLREADPDVLDPFEDDPLEAYPISKAVNNPANDTAEVIEPLDTEQSGFDAFTD